jgi:aquaporin Z
MEYDAPRRAVAEFIGTFTLLFAGVGAVVVSGQGGLVGVALAHGLALAIMITAVGHISGAHFNPAITFGFLVTRRISPMLAGLYWVSQLAGAVAACLIIRWLYPPEANLDSAVPVVATDAGFTEWEGMLLEAIMTFFLVWAVFAVAVDKKGAWGAIAGFGIGLVVAMDILFGGPITGAAMNPARAFGPELVFNDWTDAWVYYVGPLLGGAAAALLYVGLYLPRRAEGSSA